MGVENKTVIISGAGAGIGRSTALLFARRGARVVVNSATERNASAAAAQIRAEGYPCEYLSGDVSEEEVAGALAACAVSAFGSIDILVNCAGIVPQGSLLDVTASDWDHAMKVNVKSVYCLSKAVLPRMLAQTAGGSIVNVASVAAVKGFPNRALYAATKGAVVSLTKAMAADYANRNIRINCVSPGTVLTPSLQRRIDSEPDPATAKRNYESRQPMGRLGMPEEIAEAIVFLAGTDSSFATGSNLIIDGGVSI